MRERERERGEGEMAESENVWWSSETNWDVIHGDLRKRITLETSSIPDEDEAMGPTGDPLILSPLPESESCEITVKFRQRHEIHRVYLRSTARIYEIYYASDQHGENEYLCTVRCGAVESLSNTNQSDAPSAATSIDEATKNNHTDEDGWVEVKITSSVLSNGATPSLTTEVRKWEDACTLYEATAEISDASPCTLLTIRLLSVQTKGYVCIDELYIVADPVRPSHECEPSNTATTSGNASSLAMFVPSLIQLSRASTKMQQKPSTDSTKLPNGSDTETQGISQVEKPVEGDVAKVGKLKLPSELSTSTGERMTEESHFIRVQNEKSGHTFCNCRCEASVEQLNQKIDKMAAQFTVIEESMVRPLVSIETRLNELQTKLDSFQSRLDQQVLHGSDDSSYGDYDDDDDDDDDYNTFESEDESEYNNELEEQKNVALTRKTVESIMCLHYDSGNSTCSDNDHENTDGDVAIDEDDTGKEEDSHGPDSGDVFGMVSTSTSKAWPSIDEALASALSAFVSTASTPLTVTRNEQKNLANVNCIKENGRQLQHASTLDTDDEDHQLFVAEFRNDDSGAGSNLTISSEGSTDEQQPNSILDDQGGSGERMEENLTLKSDAGPSAIKPSLETGLGIINYLNERNQQFKKTLKLDSETDASLVDVEFVTDRSWRVDVPLEDLLCSEPRSLSASPVDNMGKACDNEVFPYEGALSSAIPYTVSIDKGSNYSLFEELSQMDSAAGNRVEHLDKDCNLLSLEGTESSTEPRSNCSLSEGPRLMDFVDKGMAATDPAGKFVDGFTRSGEDCDLLCLEGTPWMNSAHQMSSTRGCKDEKKA